MTISLEDLIDGRVGGIISQILQLSLGPSIAPGVVLPCDLDNQFLQVLRDSSPAMSAHFAAGVFAANPAAVKSSDARLTAPGGTLADQEADAVAGRRSDRKYR